MHPILASRSRLLPYLGAWLPVAGLLAGQLSLGSPVGWLRCLALAVPLCTVYAFVCLGAWYPCRALPLRRTSLARAAVAHLIGATVSAALWLGLARLLASLLSRLDPGLADVARGPERIGPLLATGTLLYLLSVALHYLLVAAEESQEAEQRALRAELASREAELEALRAQLDPHFLFNSLNTIASLIPEEPQSAERAIEDLADLFRGSMRRADSLISLSEELDLARRYLQMEQRRLGDRLRVNWRVSELPEGASILPLTLQPLLENAVGHGIQPRADGGEIKVYGRAEKDNVVITISNPSGSNPAAEA